MAGLAIDRRLDGEVAVLAPRGDVSVELIPVLNRAVEAALGEGAKHLLFDLRDLHFMDSASLGALLHLSQRRAKQGGKVAFFAPSASFKRLIDGSGLGGSLVTVPDEASARRLLA
jgi:anti-anti-sigma factor